MSDQLVTEWRYAIGQRVQLLPLQCSGIIMARMDRGVEQEYQLVWWSDGRRHHDWLLATELGR